jgi:uroporphyrin-III C-methyltransferase/precorrin-2 dehydrogenase/sirohydrochlorin ferrochelatase
LVAAARQGKRVVRLKCGDPGIFARGSEEADALTAAGITYEVVPGVTAASAASAALGGFLTQRGTCDTLVLATGQSEVAGKKPDWMNILHPGTRVALYMGVGSAGSVAQALIDGNIDRHIEISIVSRAQQPDQIIAACTAATLVDTIKKYSISNPAILFLTWPRPIAQAAATPPIERISA